MTGVIWSVDIPEIMTRRAEGFISTSATD